MEFIAKLKTTEEYDSSDIVVAFHKCLERGEENLRNAGNDFHADIITEFMDNNPIIERE